MLSTGKDTKANFSKDGGGAVVKHPTTMQLLNYDLYAMFVFVMLCSQMIPTADERGAICYKPRSLS